MDTAQERRRQARLNQHCRAHSPLFPRSVANHSHSRWMRQAQDRAGRAGTDLGRHIDLAQVEGGIASGTADSRLRRERQDRPRCTARCLRGQREHRDLVVARGSDERARHRRRPLPSRPSNTGVGSAMRSRPPRRANVRGRYEDAQLRWRASACRIDSGSSSDCCFAHRQSGGARRRGVQPLAAPRAVAPRRADAPAVLTACRPTPDKNASGAVRVLDCLCRWRRGRLHGLSRKRRRIGA